MLICLVYELNGSIQAKKLTLVRIPIRLGEDVFTNGGNISDQKLKKLLKAFSAYKNIMEVYEVDGYIAAATSAMRDANNGEAIATSIRQNTGINVQIIDGDREAEIIYSTHIADKLRSKRNYAYIDVGGGSTEITIISKKEKIKSASFNIGTVRMMLEKTENPEWKRMKMWICKETKSYKPLVGIGTGGNITKIFSLLNGKSGSPVFYSDIKALNKELKKYNVDERIKNLKLKPDRADVITHAADIYLYVMKWAQINKIYVPKAGIVDGLIQMLYEQKKAQAQRRP